MGFLSEPDAVVGEDGSSYVVHTFTIVAIARGRRCIRPHQPDAARQQFV